MAGTMNTTVISHNSKRSSGASLSQFVDTVTLDKERMNKKSSVNEYIAHGILCKDANRLKPHII